MTRVDFYLLADTTPSARQHFACRIADKAYRGGHCLYLHTNHLSEAQALDDLLWTYRDDSFLPHNLYGDNKTPVPPIQIGYATPPPDHHDILLNMSLEIPHFYGQFQRVIEIIAADELSRQQARQRYKLYQQQGCELQSHRL